MENVFRVPDLNVACTDRCELNSLDCFARCNANDSACWSQCLRENTECIKCKITSCYAFMHYYRYMHCKNISSACPCEVNCLDGCDECDNPVCDCQVRFSGDSEISRKCVLFKADI